MAHTECIVFVELIINTEKYTLCQERCGKSKKLKEILGLNITEMKKCTRGIQKQVCRGRRFCKLNNRTMEIVESEEQEEK